MVGSDYNNVNSLFTVGYTGKSCACASTPRCSVDARLQWGCFRKTSSFTFGPHAILWRSIAVSSVLDSSLKLGLLIFSFSSDMGCSYDVHIGRKECVALLVYLRREKLTCFFFSDTTHLMVIRFFQVGPSNTPSLDAAKPSVRELRSLRPSSEL